MKGAHKIQIMSAGMLTSLIIAFFGAGASATEVKYVGRIFEQLHSPTSIVASNDFVAVLDPYEGTISVFSPDGFSVRKINLDGDAFSLTRIDAQTYAFCDRIRKAVVAYDIGTDRQYDYLDGNSGLDDPVDLVSVGEYMHVLDAGNSFISVFRKDRSLVGTIPLKDETGADLIFASSFVYDQSERLYHVLDQTNSRICRFDTSGQYLGSVSAFGANDGRITRGGEIELTDNGLILVTDRYQGRIGIFGQDGTFFGFFGGGDDGPGLSIPTGISIDESGLVYVVSTMGAAIDVYFLPPVIDEADLLTVIQRYPEDGSELAGDGIMLEAAVEAYRAADYVNGFEFQIFDSESADYPMSESPVIRPGSCSDLGGNRQRITAAWNPQLTFHDQTSYWWRSRVFANDTVGDWTATNSFRIAGLPRDYRLSQNVPNPFNPETCISFTVATAGDVILEVISLLGQRIRTLVRDRLAPGDYQVTWDGIDHEGRRVASGIYFYRLRAGDFTQTRKMVLLK